MIFTYNILYYFIYFYMILYYYNRFAQSAGPSGPVSIKSQVREAMDLNLTLKLKLKLTPNALESEF